MLDYTVTINSVDFTSAIERDSYKTTKTPVYSKAVTTMDGVSHVVKLRNKNKVSFELNPQIATNMGTLCAALLTEPCSVYFYSLQSQAYETSNMVLEKQTAQYLSRCLAGGLKWSQVERIELTEL